MHSLFVTCIFAVPLHQDSQNLNPTYDFGPTYGKDYQGYDYSILYWSTPSSMSDGIYRQSALKCQALCESDSQCYAWTYVPPGADQAAPERCCLKNPVIAFPIEADKPFWTGAASRAVNWQPGSIPYPGDNWIVPQIHYSPDCLRVGGWHDIAGTMTLVEDDDSLIHHVFQGCPGNGGWHHGVSHDLIHWQDAAVPVSPVAIHETYQGMDSYDSPCSGFVVVDDDGQVCAGFRQCSSDQGFSHPWDVPLELRCAKDSSLTSWNDPEYIFDFYFGRALPYDPVRPWKGKDGMWYATIAADSCNGTTSTCLSGSAQFLYSSPRLHGDGANWQMLGIMFASNRTVLNHGPQGGNRYNEFVTPDFFGGLPGDPLNGTTKVMLDNGYHGYTTYFVGLQDDGQEFRPDWNKVGAVDYGGFAPYLRAGMKGLDAISDTEGMVFGMSRTFGARDPNHVNVNGRRVLVGWLQGHVALMSLPRDLSLDSNGNLLQQFVPEFAALRVPQSHLKLDVTFEGMLNTSQQMEVVLRVSYVNQSSFGFSILQSPDLLEYTSIIINTTSEVVIVDARKQGNDVARAGPLELNSDGTFHVHAIIDHSIITVIVNNRTAITVFTNPTSPYNTGLSVFGLSNAEGTLEKWDMQSANPTQWH
eukprot:c6820_g1_i1.p1 GENE.c6820_g1_i1~~c6820_g1_i1.p1  ORF type:complete len:642 (-),score=131.63 c6820_g1_i1:877-2802(-)